MKLLLSTLHSKYIHSSLALPSLAAFCVETEGLTTVIREFTVNERPDLILRRVVAEDADVAAFSCHIWNIEQTLRLIADLKLVNPGIFVILGGPEVSYGSHKLLADAPFVDCIVRGEGEETFRELIRLLVRVNAGAALTDELLSVIDGISFRSGDEIISTPDRPPITNLDTLPSPFAAGLADMTKPLVYTETSRGCPFSCAFCISSIDRGVRTYSQQRIESDLGMLMSAGAQTIKLVDRTFNYDAKRANRIWEFILSRNRTSLFHFEIAADLLTDDNIRFLRNVPYETFRFEIGVQSTALSTLESVGRRSDLELLFNNVRRLKEETAVTLHLDLVAGLPGEDFAGFSASLQRLLEARPHHVQVEPLKVLKGTAMRKIAREKGYAWSPAPPYRILSTPWLSFSDITRIEESAAGVERFYNSGRFPATLELASAKIPLTTLFTSVPDPDTASAAKGNSLPLLFKSFLQHLENALPETMHNKIIDALRFDYCMSGYPGTAIPGFLSEDGKPCSSLPPPLQYPEISSRLNLPLGTRLRTFTSRFICDYTRSSREDRGCLITFAYTGQGLVRTLSTEDMES